MPRLDTNEAQIVEWTRATELFIDDPRAVFAYVLGQLPARVQVYPTENYYYFRFVHAGVPYGGNIRLAPGARDRGEVYFSYGEEVTDWNRDPPDRFAALGPTQGVTVEREAPLVYRVSHDGKSVTFALNDLSAVKPPPGLLRADERYIGPVFDESAIRFFLVFNSRLRIFHYILDETQGVADQLFAPEPDIPIRIGKRTGFAFYNYENRNILVGVSAAQLHLNTMLDGPFDQLPENFIEGESLRDAIEASDPKVKGKIDRLGHYSDGASRHLIHPYLPYWEEGVLAAFHRCVTSKQVAASERPRCFAVDEREQRSDNPRPLPLMRR